MTVLSLTIQEFPPSVNRLYFSLPRGGKAMTTEGLRFQRHVISIIATEHGPSLKKFDANKPYTVELMVYFPEIYNKGWPKTAQQRYKRRDATNLIKLLEDTLAKAIGVDDANFLRFTVEKRMDPKCPRIEIRISEYQEANHDPTPRWDR